MLLETRERLERLKAPLNVEREVELRACGLRCVPFCGAFGFGRGGKVSSFLGAVVFPLKKTWEAKILFSLGGTPNREQVRSYMQSGV